MRNVPGNIRNRRRKGLGHPLGSQLSTPLPKKLKIVRICTRAFAVDHRTLGQHEPRPKLGTHGFRNFVNPNVVHVIF
jgi:hypothetical protein